MKKNHLWLLFFALAVTISSCKKDDVPKGYTGTNEIYLESEKDPVLILGDKGSIKVLLKSTQRADRDTRFELNIKSLNEKDKSIPVEIKEKEIILKKGERQVEFHLVEKEGGAGNDGAKFDIKQYDLSIPSMPDKQMKLRGNLRFRLLNIAIPDLTPAKIQLIEGYKEKGMDITPFLGKIPVKTTVNIPVDGLVEGFKKPAIKKYEGFSVITLSEHATADKPVLKMTNNPMGLTEFFYFALRKQTIENDEFWFAPLAAPNFKVICELIKWNKNSVEQFSASLDSIRVGKEKRDDYLMELLGKSINQYDEYVEVVPFSFEYSAWDRHKKLIAEKNKIAIECKETDATPCPNHWLNNKRITEDEYENGTFVDITGKSLWAVKEKKLKFFFTVIVEAGGGYIPVTAEYTGK